MGSDISIPVRRLEFNRGASEYQLVLHNHFGLLSSPAAVFQQRILPVLKPFLQLEGDVGCYERKTKRELEKLLYETGYPRSDPNFLSPKHMNVKVLAKLVHGMHSTIFVSLWGDHGPIDGKSHVLFTQSYVYHRYLFKPEVKQETLRMLEREMQQPDTVAVCRLTSETDVSVAAMRIVGDSYRNAAAVEYQDGKFLHIKIRFYTGDLKWLAIVAMILQGGCSAYSYPHPTTELAYPDFRSFVIGSLCKRRSMATAATALANGPYGKRGIPINQLNAVQLREEAEAHGINKYRPGPKIRYKSKKHLSAEIRQVLKGLNYFDGFGHHDIKHYVEDGFLSKAEIGLDSMHTIKGLYLNMTMGYLERLAIGAADKREAVADFKVKRTALGTEKGTSRACDARKELATSGYLFAKFSPEVKKMMLSFAMMSKILYLRESDRGPRTILAYSTHALLFHHIMVQKLGDCLRIDAKTGKQKSLFDGKYFVTLVYEFPLHLRLSSGMTCCCELTERVFGQYRSKWCNCFVSPLCLLTLSPLVFLAF